MYPLLLKNTVNDEDSMSAVIKPDEFSDAQCYLLSALDECESVVKNGVFARMGINEALKKISGGSETADFPVTIKLINTKERLPVTVYPDDESAALIMLQQENLIVWTKLPRLLL